MNMTAYEIRMSAWSSDVGSSDLDGGVVQLFTMVPSTGVVTQLAEIVGFANGESGLSFDADGNLWILNEEAGAAQVDPVTGELIAGSEVSFPSASAATFWSHALLPEVVPTICDRNPLDPLNDAFHSPTTQLHPFPCQYLLPAAR